MAATDTHRAIDAVWRIESARLIAGLTRIVGDVGQAEDLAQDALVAALERWPETGIPDKPGAWLMATAKNRAIAVLRRNKRVERKHAQIGLESDAQRDRGAGGAHPPPPRWSDHRRDRPRLPRRRARGRAAHRARQARPDRGPCS